MTIRIGEVGKIINVGAEFDMSSNTELTLTFTSPDGNTSFTRSSADGVTAPATPSPSLTGFGIFAADEYFRYATQAADFTVAGNWCIDGTYIEGSTKTYIGDAGSLTISSRC